MKKSACPFKQFQELQANIQLYHWMTQSYARHKATDQLYKSLGQSIDRYVDVYIGKYGRPSSVEGPILLKCMSDDELTNYFKQIIKQLQGCVASVDTDLGSIRDDILAHINQAFYLFTLK
jgi:hypothetical protein